MTRTQTTEVALFAAISQWQGFLETLVAWDPQDGRRVLVCFTGGRDLW